MIDIDDIRYYFLMTLSILVIIGWCGVIGYTIYHHHVTREACTCEEAP